MHFTHVSSDFSKERKSATFNIITSIRYKYLISASERTQPSYNMYISTCYFYCTLFSFIFYPLKLTSRNLKSNFCPA